MYVSVLYMCIDMRIWFIEEEPRWGWKNWFYGKRKRIMIVSHQMPTVKFSMWGKPNTMDYHCRPDQNLITKRCCCFFFFVFYWWILNATHSNAIAKDLRSSINPPVQHRRMAFVFILLDCGHFDGIDDFVGCVLDDFVKLSETELRKIFIS